MIDLLKLGKDTKIAMKSIEQLEKKSKMLKLNGKHVTMMILKNAKIRGKKLEKILRISY